MAGKMARLDLRTVSIVIILITLSLGCLCLPTAITPTVPPPTQFVNPVITAPSVVESPLHNTGVLSQTGPWLLIETAQGLWAANPDGSGLTQLTEVDYWNGNLQDAVQPGGRQVVFISGAMDFHNMALNALILPYGNTTKITDLTSTETEVYADLSPGDIGFEALRAIGEQRSYAWSEDGNLLAFTGVMDGPSADIYLYYARTGGIQRVSQNGNQDFSPSWSPDGNNLLYLTARGFGTGAGMAMSGVWVAAGDGSGTTQLYSTGSSGEGIVGWLDNTTVVMYSFDQPCGEQALRLYDIVTQQETLLNEGCFRSAAVDHWNGAAMFSNDSGLYILSTDGLTPVQVAQEPNARIDPIHAGDYIFTVRFDLGGIFTYGFNEIFQQASPVNVDPDRLDVSMYGAIWGWTSMDEEQPGAWITGPGLETRQIFTGKAFLPTWDLDNNLLFFAPEEARGNAIYRITFDNYFQDLAVVGFIDANIYSVTWLGGQ